jgi:PmbA protein
VNVGELADRALGATEGEALALVTRERWVMLRFARSRPTQATSVDDVTVELAVLRDGHVGRGSTNGTDSDSLRRCAARATTAARATAQVSGPGHFPGFPQPMKPRAHDGHDPATAASNTETGANALRSAFEVAQGAGVQVGGIWTAGEVETAVASSSGAAETDRVTDAYMKVVAFAGDKRSGYASSTGVSVKAFEPAALAKRAAAKATAGEQILELDPGEYTVVFERDAVSELLWVLQRVAFNGMVHAEGRGALSGRLGSRVAGPSISIADSPRFPGTLPRAFDAEGVPKAPLPLIQDGVAHAVAHDTRSAAMAGTSSTGHALEPGGTLNGPHPTNLVLLGGGAADEAALCGGVERGIYVTRLWYTNPVRTEDSLFTAVTRDGTFLIEDGSVGSRVADMRVTDSALGILERTRALGAKPELCSDGEFYGRRFATGNVCPPLLAEGVTLSGSAGA